MALQMWSKRKKSSALGEPEQRVTEVEFDFDEGILNILKKYGKNDFIPFKSWYIYISNEFRN